MNLGIIAASIAPLRPLFVNLDPMVRLASDPNNRGLYNSDQPILKGSKESKLRSKLKGIPLDSLGIRTTTDSDVSQKGLAEVRESRV